MRRRRISFANLNERGGNLCKSRPGSLPSGPAKALQLMGKYFPMSCKSMSFISSLFGRKERTSTDGENRTSTDGANHVYQGVQSGSELTFDLGRSTIHQFNNEGYDVIQYTKIVFHDIKGNHANARLTYDKQSDYYKLSTGPDLYKPINNGRINNIPLKIYTKGLGLDTKAAAHIERIVTLQYAKVRVVFNKNFDVDPSLHPIQFQYRDNIIDINTIFETNIFETDGPMNAIIKYMDSRYQTYFGGVPIVLNRVSGNMHALMQYTITISSIEIGHIEPISGAGGGAKARVGKCKWTNTGRKKVVDKSTGVRMTLWKSSLTGEIRVKRMIERGGVRVATYVRL